jgi:flagellar basal-body rod protein FlgB
MDNGLSKFLFTKMGVPRFAKYLDLGSFQQKLISGNMANAATPGFESQGIGFQKEYERLTGQTNHLAGTLTHEYHIPLGQHTAKPPDVERAKIKDGDVNSVDIDQEVANLAQNELQFTIGAELLKRKFDSMRNAITSK